MGPMGEASSRDGRREIELGEDGPFRYSCLDPEQPRILPGLCVLLLGLAMLLVVGCAGGFGGFESARPCVVV